MNDVMGPILNDDSGTGTGTDSNPVKTGLKTPVDPEPEGSTKGGSK